MLFPWFAKQTIRLARRGKWSARALRNNSVKLVLERLEDRIVPTTFIWQGINGGVWTASENWGQPTAPTTGSDVVINNGTTPSFNTVVDINTLTLSAASGLAISGGTLTLDAASTLNGSISLSAGSLAAAGTETLAGATTWSGGTLTSSGAGSWTNTGAVTVPNNSGVTVQGTFNNTGTFAINSAGNLTDLVISGTFTNTGGGSITMSNTTANRIYGTGTLVNDTTNTIQGAGQIGIGQTLTLNNKGTINANVSNSLLIGTTTPVTNSATLEATAGGTLNLQATFNNSAAGVLVATDTGSIVNLNGATINGGTLTTNTLHTATPGVIENNGSATLSGVTVGTGSTLTLLNNTTTVLLGSITNKGAITQNSAGNVTDIEIKGAVSLAGGGTLTMSNTAANRVLSLNNLASDVLTNVDNTIQGAGQIGVNNLALVNQATIDANLSSTLTINAGGGVSNTGTIEATAGGQCASRQASPTPAGPSCQARRVPSPT